MILLTMLLIPTFVALMFFILSGKSITIGEFLIQNVAQVFVMSMFLIGHGCVSTSDYEVWNGRVAKKERTVVSCEHSYTCNCYQSCSSDGNGGQTCTTICQTCYEHSYDVDWDVYTTNNENIEINRVNRQGTNEPPRWTAIKIGEPTSVVHGYTNYVKAAPDSLFRRQGLVEKYAGKLVPYPQDIYDYYRYDRLTLTGGAKVSNPAAWNEQLSQINGTLGAAKQVNMAVFITKNQPEEYFYALQQYWVGAKKNDVILVMSVDDEGKIQWAEVMAWTSDKMAEVTIKDAVLKIGHVNDGYAIIQAMGNNVDRYYKRKPMKDFAYLKNTTTPTLGMWIGSMIVGLIVSIGLGILFLKNDYDQNHENDQLSGKNRYGRY